MRRFVCALSDEQPSDQHGHGTQQEGGQRAETHDHWFNCSQARHLGEAPLKTFNTHAAVFVPRLKLASGISQRYECTTRSVSSCHQALMTAQNVATLAECQPELGSALRKRSHALQPTTALTPVQDQAAHDRPWKRSPSSSSGCRSLIERAGQSLHRSESSSRL